MEEFYETLNNIIRDGIPCECGKQLWIHYSDGHIGYVCEDCEPLLDLGPAPYIGRQPEPIGPMPEIFESRDLKKEKPSWINGWGTKYFEYTLSHECKMYRKIIH